VHPAANAGAILLITNKTGSSTARSRHRPRSDCGWPGAERDEGDAVTSRAALGRRAVGRCRRDDAQPPGVAERSKPEANGPARACHFPRRTSTNTLLRSMEQIVARHAALVG